MPPRGGSTGYAIAVRHGHRVIYFDVDSTETNVDIGGIVKSANSVYSISAHTKFKEQLSLAFTGIMISTSLQMDAIAVIPCENINGDECENTADDPSQNTSDDPKENTADDSTAGQGDNDTPISLADNQPIVLLKEMIGLNKIVQPKVAVQQTAKKKVNSKRAPLKQNETMTASDNAAQD